MSHENVCQVLGCCTVDRYFILVAYQPGVEFKTVILGRSLPIDHNILLTLSLGIVKGLEYLHSKDVLHRSLCPNAIQLDQYFRPTLQGFGYRKLKDELCKKNPSLAEAPWVAPELYENNFSGADKSADIFSLGMLLWFMFARKLPFEGIPQNEIVHSIKNSKRPEFSPDFPQKVQRLVSSCWEQDSRKRFEIHSVLEALQDSEIVGAKPKIPTPSLVSSDSTDKHYDQKLDSVLHRALDLLKSPADSNRTKGLQALVGLAKGGGNIDDILNYDVISQASQCLDTLNLTVKNSALQVLLELSNYQKSAKVVEQVALDSVLNFLNSQENKLLILALQIIHKLLENNPALVSKLSQRDFASHLASLLWIPADVILSLSTFSI